MPLPQQFTRVEPIAVAAPLVRSIVPRPSPASRYANSTPSDARNAMSAIVSPKPRDSTPVGPIWVPWPVAASIVNSTFLPVAGSRPTAYIVPVPVTSIALTRQKPIGPINVVTPVSGSTA